MTHRQIPPLTSARALIAKDIKPDAVLIDGLLRRKQRMMIASRPKAGKSFAAIELAVSIASGAPWFGFDMKTTGNVVLVSYELSLYSLVERITSVASLLLGSDEEIEKAVSRIFVLDMRGSVVSSLNLIDGIVGDSRVIASETGVDTEMIIIDPLYRMFSAGGENDPHEIRKVTGALETAQEETGSAICFVHHHRKGAGAASRSFDRYSGSSVLMRDIDASVDLTELGATDDYRKALQVSQSASAWVTSFEVRDFAQPKRRGVVFDCPLHILDECGAWEDLELYEALTPAKMKGIASRSRHEQLRDRKGKAIKKAVAQCHDDHVDLSLSNLAERISIFDGVKVTESTLKNWQSSLRRAGENDYNLVKGVLIEIDTGANSE